jgi:D-alanyl-D-alanine dipeptidase
MLLSLVLLLLSVRPMSAAASLPEGFVYLEAIAPDIVQEIRYATPDNFTGRPVSGYRAGRCILTRPAAEALAQVQAALAQEGLGLKVYDCYRPQRAVDAFVRWGQNPRRQEMKAQYYPRLDKARVFEDGYIATRSGHSRGSTVDLTLIPRSAQKLPLIPKPKAPLIDCTAPAATRAPDSSLDMGTGYDCFDPLAHTEADGINPIARQNRLKLRAIMQAHGFRNLPQEWWHFNLEAEPYPERYFNFPVH